MRLLGEDETPDFQVRRRTTPLREPATKRVRRRHRYSRRQILTAIQVWTQRYGEPPAMIDWEPARARRLGQDWRAERFEADTWPTARMVRSRFHRFNAAVEAAGLVPRRAPTRVRPNISGSSAILDAIVEWTRRYGDVPTMADWDPVRARRLNQHWRIARYEQGDWPSARSVARHFGRFSTAIAVAGLAPRPASRQHDGRSDARAVNRLAIVRQEAAATSAPGVKDFAASLNALAAARSSGDPVAMHVALLDVAASAMAWAELVD